MTEFYEGDNSCVRCLRSSPIASLIGFIIVLIGGGIFGGATVFARRYLITLLNAQNLFPYLDYAVYGLVGAVGLFSLLAYLICALSSGWNAKHCFESSRKACCGRCCNITLIILLVIVILVWTAIACLVSYPVISIALLLHRNEGPTRLRLASLERYTSGLTDSFNYGTANFVQSISNNNPNNMNYASYNTLQRTKRQALDPSSQVQPPSSQSKDWSNLNEGIRKLDEPVENVSVETSPTETKPIAETTKEITDPNVDITAKQTNLDSAPSRESINSSPTNKLLNQVGDKALSVANSIRMFFKCSQDTLDLSYYGLYDATGLPLHMARANFTERIKVILICVGLAVIGIFLLLLGYVQIIICTAINYARMQEARYYEASEAGEEGVALQQ